MTESDIKAKIKQYEDRLAAYVCNLADLSPDLVFRLRRDIVELRHILESKQLAEK